MSLFMDIYLYDILRIQALNVSLNWDDVLTIKALVRAHNSLLLWEWAWGGLGVGLKV